MSEREGEREGEAETDRDRDREKGCVCGERERATRQQARSTRGRKDDRGQAEGDVRARGGRGGGAGKRGGEGWEGWEGGGRATGQKRPAPAPRETVCGEVWYLVLPVASWPLSLLPQHARAPPESSAHMCTAPSASACAPAAGGARGREPQPPRLWLR